MTPRSYLFVPGDRADRLAGAGTRGADAVIADLEDAVAPARRAEARAVVLGWLAGLETGPFEAWVRAGTPSAGDDLEVVGPTLTGLMLPKVEGAGVLHQLAGQLDGLEAGAGLPAGSIRLLPIVETARALRSIDEIAAAPRVARLMIGEFDLGAELGLDPADPGPFLPLRMQVVVASAAAGIAPPLGPVSPDYRDLVAFEADTRRLERQGFGSRPAIHPAQVPVINQVFTPSPAVLERARRLVDLYDAALAAGTGAVTDENGRMVDEAVVRSARRLLESAPRPGRA